MLFLLVATLLSWGLWSAFGRPKTAFLPEFATLLDRPEFVHGLENTLPPDAPCTSMGWNVSFPDSARPEIQKTGGRTSGPPFTGLKLPVTSSPLCVSRKSR
jgi:hypothetical protein